MTKAEEIKARLRRYARVVEDFSDSKNRSSVNKAKFIRLDMALSAIDELAGNKTTTTQDYDKRRSAS